MKYYIRSMLGKLKNIAKTFSPAHQTLHLEYKVDLKPRLTAGTKFFARMSKIIDSRRSDYQNTLVSFVKFREEISLIKDVKIEKNSGQPVWNNGFLPGLDIIALYSLIAMNNPKVYIEIGSGNSTKVVRKAIKDYGLQTKIVSIDPQPRAEIDLLADEIIRKPFEDIDDYSFILNQLGENDVLFIDNSHRCFPNSDATTCFLELLPFISKNVIVHFHDIYLPFEYPQFMCDRFYNEQYMLAAFIISNPSRYQTLLPNFYVSQDKELSSILNPFWELKSLKDVEQHGGSYWLKIGE